MEVYCTYIIKKYSRFVEYSVILILVGEARKVRQGSGARKQLFESLEEDTIYL